MTTESQPEEKTQAVVPKSLSDFWRIRKSHDRAIEMRGLLDGLKSLIELAADEGDFNVRWAAKSKHMSGEEKKVTLSYMPLREVDTPFPGHVVDVVVGFAAHEAGHRIRKDSEVRKLRPDERPEGMSESFECLVSNILEDVYIDRYLYQYAPILKRYIERGRGWDKTRPQWKADLERLRETEQLSKIDLLNLWIDYELYSVNTAEELKGFSEEALNTLLNLAEITDAYCKKGGLVDAKTMYEAIWNEFSSYSNPAKPETGNGQPDGDGDSGVSLDDQDQSERQGDEGEEGGEEQGAEEKGADEGGDSSAEDEQPEAQSEEPDEQPSEDSEEDSEQDDDTELGSEGTTQPEDDDHNENEDKDKDGGEGEGSEDEQPDDGEEESEEAYADGLYANALTCMDEEAHEIPEDIRQAIEESILLQREDLTQDLAEEYEEEAVFQDLQQYHDNVIVEKSPEGILIRPHDEITRSVKQMFKFRQQRKTRYSRGTEEGKLSQRRLYRAAWGSKHIYERKDIEDNLDLGICILVDASSSVSASWPLIEQVMSSIATGLGHRKGIKLIVVAYNSDMNGRGVYMYRLHESGSNEIGTCKSSGGTPSTAALGTVPMLMRRLVGKTKDSLIIHITDGYAHDESICKTTLGDLVKTLKAKYNTDVYCLAITCPSVVQMRYERIPSVSEYMSNQLRVLEAAYGNSFAPLADYKELPNALKELLRNILVVTS